MFDMKNKFIFLVILFFNLVMLISDVYADNLRIEPNSKHLVVQFWKGIYHVNNLDIEVNLSLTLKVFNDDLKEDITLSYMPLEFNGDSDEPQENFFVDLCYQEDCKEKTKLKYNITQGPPQTIYKIDITKDILKLEKNDKSKDFWLHINYILPNYVLGSTEPFFSKDRTVILTAYCYTNDPYNKCPDHNMAEIQIFLPENIILRDFSEGGSFVKEFYIINQSVSKKRLGLYWNDFGSNFSNPYGTKYAQYTDIGAEKIYFVVSIFLSVIIGVLLSGFLSYKITYKYYEKSKRGVKTDLQNLKDELSNATKSYIKALNNLNNKLIKQEYLDKNFRIFEYKLNEIKEKIQNLKAKKPKK